MDLYVSFKSSHIVFGAKSALALSYELPWPELTSKKSMTLPSNTVSVVV